MVAKQLSLITLSRKKWSRVAKSPINWYSLTKLNNLRHKGIKKALITSALIQINVPETEPFSSRSALRFLKLPASVTFSESTEIG